MSEEARGEITSELDKSGSASPKTRRAGVRGCKPEIALGAAAVVVGIPCLKRERMVSESPPSEDAFAAWDHTLQ